MCIPVSTWVSHQDHLIPKSCNFRCTAPAGPLLFSMPLLRISAFFRAANTSSFHLPCQHAFVRKRLLRRVAHDPLPRRAAFFLPPPDPEAERWYKAMRLAPPPPCQRTPFSPHRRSVSLWRFLKFSWSERQRRESTPWRPAPEGRMQHVTAKSQTSAEPDGAGSG